MEEETNKIITTTAMITTIHTLLSEQLVNKCINGYRTKETQPGGYYFTSTEAIFPDSIACVLRITAINVSKKTSTQFSLMVEAVEASHLKLTPVYIWINTVLI